MTRFIQARRDGDDDGFTLIELLVSMVLLISVMSFLTAAVIRTLHSQTGVQARTTNTASAETAMDRITTDLREAVPLNDNAASAVTAATTTSITFTTNVRTIASGASTVSVGPTTVTFSLGTNATSCPSPDYCLFEADTPSVMGAITVNGQSYTEWVAGTTTTTKVLVHGYNSAQSTPLFSYYQTTICSTATDSTCNAASPRRTLSAITMSGSSVPAASLPNIDTMDVTLSLDTTSPGTNVPATTVENRVSMPNQSSSAASAATI